MVLECRIPPTGANRQLKGPEGLARKKQESLQGGGERGRAREKKISLSSKVEPAENLSPTFLVFCLLLGNPAHYFGHTSHFPSKCQRKVSQEEEEAVVEGESGTAAASRFVSLSGSEGGGDQWPRGAKQCADMSFTPPLLPPKAPDTLLNVQLEENQEHMR